MRIVRVAEQRTMPWKNGGGETTEIAVSPLGAALDDFEWRVSMARVARDGLFSRFTGVDRTLMIVDGDGLALAIGGASEIVLTIESPPYAFAGEVATIGRLLGGPILDLNVMTRRGRWTHRLITPAISGPTPLAPPPGDVWIVIAAGDPLAIATTAPAHALVPLARHDAAIFDAPVMLVPEGVSRVYVVELRRST